MCDLQRYIIRFFQPLNTYVKRNIYQIFIENLLRIVRRKSKKEKFIALFYCTKILIVYIVSLIFMPLTFILMISKYRFLTIDLAQIGSLLYLDTFIKENILNRNVNRYKYIIHANPSHISNSYLLDRYDEYIIQVKNIFQYIILFPFANNILVSFNVKKYEPINKYHCTRLIQNKYYEVTKKPLISMPLIDINSCNQVLNKLGVEDNKSKFVALHVRESEFYNNKKGSYRNGNIKDYIDGIKFLVDEGYYVIRLGNNKMSNIDDMVAEFNGKLIDYANSVFVSEIMDVFLLSECDFLVCTNSGPYVVPLLFNRNICETNFYPLHETLAFINGDISIFKKIVNINDGSYVSLEEILNSELCMPLQYPEHVKRGLKLIDNTADEILWAIKDFLTKNRDPENTVYQEYAYELFKQGKWHGSFGSKGEYSIHYLKEYLLKTGEINSVNLS